MLVKKQKREIITPYCNKEYEVWLAALEQKKVDNCNRFYKSSQENLLPYVTEIAIQISNLCNYANMHKKCPVSCEKEKLIMSMGMVKHIIDELVEESWSGVLCFHIYNEPLIDPRLFSFIQYAKEKITDVEIEVYSNGYYLNDVMVQDLQNIGVDILIVTAYGNAEYFRLKNLTVSIPYSLVVGNLDERLDNYDTNRIEEKKKYPICKGFISQVCIYANGELGVCCLDYKHPYNLGYVFPEGIKWCLNKREVINCQLELQSGKRVLPICKNCNWNR